MRLRSGLRPAHPPLLAVGTVIQVIPTSPNTRSAIVHIRSTFATGMWTSATPDLPATNVNFFGLVHMVHLIKVIYAKKIRPRKSSHGAHKVGWYVDHCGPQGLVKKGSLRGICRDLLQRLGYWGRIGKKEVRIVSEAVRAECGPECGPLSPGTSLATPQVPDRRGAPA